MFNKSYSLMPLALAVGLLAAPAVSARPPTVDPTYGLPPPHASTQPRPAYTAHWVWADATRDNQTIFLRRAFDLATVPKTVPLYVTADDFFTLYVNGKQVDQSVPDPNDKDIWQHVHKVNVAPYLTAGRNVLAVQAVNVSGAAGVVVRLELPDRPPLETDAQWKVFDGPEAPADWSMAAFDDSAWASAKVIAPLAGGLPWAGAVQGWPGDSTTVPYLAHLMLPWVKVLDVHPGAGRIEGAGRLAGNKGTVTVTPPPAGVTDPPSLVLDFGREVAGRVRVDAQGPGVVLVGTGESTRRRPKRPGTDSTVWI